MDTDGLKDIVSRLCDVLHTRLKDLNSIWIDCGYSTDDAVSRGETVYQNVVEMLKEMVEEEQANKQQLIVGVENLLKEATTLSNDLNIIIDSSSCLNVPLYKLEENLSLKLEEYRKIKMDRMSRYEALKEREEQLCLMLGVEQNLPSPNNVVTEDQLSAFEEHITLLSQKEVASRERFVNTKTNIISMLCELEEQPSSSFEKEVVGEDTKFIVSTRNMVKLQELHEELEKRLDKKKQYVHQLREKLNLLWVRLRENTLHQAEFLRAHPGFSNATIAELKEEIYRCEIKKRQNIALFIFNIRRELEELWDQCFYSKEDRSKFLPFDSESFNEELLELHENEVKKLREHFENNRNLYCLVRDWNGLMGSLKVINEKSADKTRLFRNRGGELLKEEREKKLTERKLKKMEDEIVPLLNNYEIINGTSFLYFGEELRKLLPKRRGTLQESKAKEIFSKKRENLAAGAKRKIPNGYLSNSKKRAKQDLPGGSDDQKVSRKLNFPSTAENEEANEHNENPRNYYFDDVEYHCFQNGIERINERVPCRSTMISGILNPKNTGRGVRSPTKPVLIVKSPLAKYRTPVKPPRKFIGTPLTSPRTPQNQLRARVHKGRPSSAPRPHRLL